MAGVPSISAPAPPEQRRSFAESRLPPKVLALARSVFELLDVELERASLNSLAEFETQLFGMAEQARSHAIQSQHLQALHKVRERSADLLPGLRQRLEATLAGVRDRVFAADAAAESLQPDGLELVEVEQMDEAVVLNEIAGHAEMRAALPLFLLGQRFGVLARRPGFDAESLPVGPLALGRMFAQSAHCLDLGDEYRLLLLRQFDRQLTLFCGTLYERVNECLARGGVLPHLTYVPHRPRPVAQPVSGAPQPGARRAPAASVAASAEAEPQRPSSDAVRPPAVEARSGVSPDPTVDVAPEMARWPGMPTAPPAGAAAAAEPAAGGEGDQVLFDTLRHLLANRRALLGKFGGRPDRGAPVEPARTAAPEAVRQALDRLQRSQLAPLVRDGKIVPRSVADLKQDLLLRLRAEQPDGAAVGLPADCNDTMELVGMLFDHLVRDVRPSSPAAGLLTRLQVPLLRVALEDRAFFDDAEHPARQLLGTVAETADWFSSEDPADQAMLGRVRQVVDRVVGEFSGDVGLLQTLLDDVRQHLQVQVRRSEVAERRHVEAARGKEKLELARAQAQQAMARLIEGRELPRFASGLLSQSWTDVLALAILRHGADSPQVQQQIDVARRLVESAVQREQAPQARSPEGAEINALRGEIEQGLLQVGYHAEDAEAVSQRLAGLAPVATDDREAPSSTELSLRLRQRPRFGAEAGSERDDPDSLSPAQRELYQKLRRLPFGTWFEAIDADGQVSRRRLSWFSPVTGRALFVNHRGHRLAECTLSSLARDMEAGRIRLLSDVQVSIVDRAWKAILGALRAFGGRGETADGAPQVKP